jgi:hypothetical protein
MLTITMRTSSSKAIELAKKMLASKKQTDDEMQEYRKTPAYKARVKELMQKNAEKANVFE